MRKNWILFLFVVLGFGIHSPTANAVGFVDVQYNVVMDITYSQSAANLAVSPMAGVMTIRYDHAGTGTGTTIAAGGAQLRSMLATGPLVLNLPGLLSMTGTAWLSMGPGSVGTWGTSIPFDNASFTKASGLNLPGLSGLMTFNAHCMNGGLGTACTRTLGMPTASNPHSNPTPFTNKVIKGFGNFNTAGPPATLSFKTLSGVSIKTHNIALSMFGFPIPMELRSLVGTETSRTFIPAPEPNTALLLGGGMIGLACFGSMRRRKS